MSVESLPKLEQVERQIGERMRELQLLRSLRRILQRKQKEDKAAESIDLARGRQGVARDA